MSEDSGLSKLTEETIRGKKVVEDKGRLEALCRLVDEKLGQRATVVVERQVATPTASNEEGSFLWCVKVWIPGTIYIEVRHWIYGVALGMVASALKTEGM